MSSATRDRIVDAAERLFGELGFAGTSIRRITRAADVNIAAINYHFGSKEELLRAVLSRIVEPVNRERLAMLEEAESRYSPDPPTVEAILEAFVAPDLRAIEELGERGRTMSRFLGRSYTEPTELVQRMMKEQFGELGERFHAALCRSVPGVGPDEMWWRLMAVVSVITYMLGAPDESGLTTIGGEEMLRRMIAFIGPGLRAPGPG